MMPCVGAHAHAPEGRGCPRADVFTHSEAPCAACAQLWACERACTCEHALPPVHSWIRQSSLMPLASSPSNGTGHTEGPTPEALLPRPPPPTDVPGGGACPTSPLWSSPQTWGRGNGDQLAQQRQSGVGTQVSRARAGPATPGAVAVVPAAAPAPSQARSWGRRKWVTSALPSGSSAGWGTQLGPPQAGRWPSPGTVGPQGMVGPSVKPGSSFLANADVRLSGRSQDLCPEVRDQARRSVRRSRTWLPPTVGPRLTLENASLSLAASFCQGPACDPHNRHEVASNLKTEGAPPTCQGAPSGPQASMTAQGIPPARYQRLNRWADGGQGGLPGGRDTYRVGSRNRQGCAVPGAGQCV